MSAVGAGASSPFSKKQITTSWALKQSRRKKALAIGLWSNICFGRSVRAVAAQMSDIRRPAFWTRSTALAVARARTSISEARSHGHTPCCTSTSG